MMRIVNLELRLLLWKHIILMCDKKQEKQKQKKEQNSFLPALIVSSFKDKLLKIIYLTEQRAFLRNHVKASQSAGGLSFLASIKAFPFTLLWGTTIARTRKLWRNDRTSNKPVILRMDVGVLLLIPENMVDIRGRESFIFIFLSLYIRNKNEIINKIARKALVHHSSQ